MSSNIPIHLQQTNVAKQFIGIFLIAGLLIAAYASSTAISSLWTDRKKSVERGSDLEFEDVPKVPMVVDWGRYLELLNEDLLNSLLDNLDFDEDMLRDMLNDPNVMENLQDILENQLGMNLDPSMFDNLPPELLLGVLGIPVFYVTASPTEWPNPDSQFFLTTTYDAYDTSDFTWKASVAMSSELSLPFDTNLNGINLWQITYPFTASANIKSAIPTAFPSPRIVDMTMDTTPALTAVTGPNLLQQTNLGGAFYEVGYGTADAKTPINLTYQLRYNSADYRAPSYYRSNSLPMNFYSSNNALVTACLKGPQTGLTNMEWDTYKSNNPKFTALLSEIQDTSDYKSASNTYTKMESILKYIGDNITVNLNYDKSPATGEDPVEWLSGTRTTKNPLYVSNLAVMAARALGISTRSGSGYRYDAALADVYYASPYPSATDPSKMVYPMIYGYTSQWPIAFIPTSASSGEWVEFSLKINRQVSDDFFNNTGLQVKYNNENFTLNLPYYEKTDSIDFEFNLTVAGQQINEKGIQIYDETYDNRYIGQTSPTGTNGELPGISRITLSLTDFEAGPHLLRFETEYGGENLFNYTFPMLNVRGNLSVEMNPIDPGNVTSNAPPLDKRITITGTVKDIALNRPVKNAELLVNIFKRDTLFNVTSNMTGPNFLKTNGTGQFNLSTGIYVVQNNYSVNVTFTSRFDVQDQFNNFAGDLEPLKDAYLMIPYYTIAPISYVGDRQNFTMIDNFNTSMSFAINNTIPNLPSDPTTPINGTRDLMSLLFQINTTRGLGPCNATILIKDLSRGDAIVTTILVDNSGTSESEFIINQNNPELWTAGAHLLYAIWVNETMGVVQTSFPLWVMVHAPVQIGLNPYNEFFNPHTGTNSYWKGNQSHQFTIGGNMKDPLTNMVIRNYRIHYGLVDEGYNNVTDFMLDTAFQSNPFVATVGSEGLFSKNFFFDNNTNLLLNYRTQAFFEGYYFNPQISYDGSPVAWDNDWNAIWRAYYIEALPKNESIGLLRLVDSENIIFRVAVDTWSNTVTKSDIFNTTNPPVIKTSGQTVTFFIQFIYVDTTPIVTVNINDITASFPGIIIGSNTTLASFNATTVITKQYGVADKPGPHLYNISMVFGGDTRYELTYVYYDPVLECTLARSAGDDIVDRTNPSDTIQFTGFLGASGQGLIFAQVSFEIIYPSGATRTIGDLFTKSNDSPTYNGQYAVLSVASNGAFTIRLAAKNTNIPIGNYSIKAIFEGLYTTTAVEPVFEWTNPAKSINSSVVNFMVYDRPIIDDDGYSAAPVDIDDTWIVFDTELTFSGYLTYSNSTSIANQQITLTIYNSSSQYYDSFTTTTDIFGYYEFDPIPWDIPGGDVSKYRISIAANHTAYLFDSQTTMKNIVYV
jgi:hypothetical protein